LQIKDLVKGMREHREVNQAKFARLLGCSQVSISRYEAGDVEPGAGILLRLHSIGDNAERRELMPYIKEALGDRDADWRDVVPGDRRDQVEQLLLVKEKPAGQRAMWHAFIDAALNLSELDREMDASLVEMLQIWSSNPHSQQLKEAFRDALGHVRLELRRPRASK
jgi:transcriptional regulator with XRE-family HTH domain